ncbi:MAG: transposase, partial [Gammaproteobacteria bacterium]|nr:transposase [Gammaproteobacteria bacterium]
MPKPRKQLISLEATSYYHCVSRCVRRAYLCGVDNTTGVSYEHRRAWVEERINELTGIYSIKIAAFAVMSNHYHLLLHINADQLASWSNFEVCERWHKLCKGTVLTQRFIKGDSLTKAEFDAVEEKLDEWRERLGSISWFMSSLNEWIARQANAEDKCTGRFWEGRFKSQALLDDKAIAACMAYIDLNPIRAKMADTPEESEHTSIKRRIDELKSTGGQPNSLMPFVGNPREPMPDGLPFHLQDYIELVEWSGRIIKENKRGSISQDKPPILNRIGVDPRSWAVLTSKFESLFKSLVGEPKNLR